MRPRTSISRMACACAGVLVSIAMPAAAQGADRVYFTDEGGNRIAFASLDNSGAGVLPISGVTVQGPEGIVFDPAAGRLYFTNYGSQKIAGANDDGSGGALINTSGATTSFPFGLSIDAAAQKLYWGNAPASPNDPISFANIAGTGADINTAGATPPANPLGVAVDPQRGRVWWTNTFADKISFAKLDGTGGADFVTGAPVSVPEGLAIDPEQGRIYWANSMGGTIGVANLDGSNAGTLNTTGATSANPMGVAVDVDAGRVYWANNATGTISYARTDNSGGGDLSMAGVTPGEASFPALLKAPDAVERPFALSPVVPLGASLQCSNGEWKPDLPSAFLFRAPRAFSYQWFRDDKAIAGASERSYTPTEAGTYSCKVTASNVAGSAVRTTTYFLARVPLVREYKIVPRSFKAATRGPSAVAAKGKPKPGAKVSFLLDGAATVRFGVTREQPGRKAKNGKCVAQNHGNRNRKRCKRTVTLKGAFSRNGVAGANSFRFTGRLNSRKLRPGKYKLTATPSVGKEKGMRSSATFAIKR